MKKYIVVGALLLGACGTVPNPVNRDGLAKVEAGYGVALSVAVGYRDLYDKNPCTIKKPLSTSNYCAQRDVVMQLQGADRVVQQALVRLRLFVKDNPTLDASAYVAALMNAIADFQAIQTQYGVK